MSFTPRPSRRQFEGRVRLAVSGQSEIFERYAANLSEGGMFVRDDAPPPVGSLILLEFVLPSGQPLSRVAAKVVHSKPAAVAGDKTAGMGLQFVKLDSIATEVVEHLNASLPDKALKTPNDQSESQLFTVTGLEAPLIAASGPIIGIDLGTVNSCAAVIVERQPVVISGQQGYNQVPSIIFVGQKGETLVGHKASERMILEPDRAIYGSKRFLGRAFLSREVQTFGHFFNWDIVAGADGRAAAKVGGITIRLEEVSGLILACMRQMAETQLGQKVTRAVITIPAYFGEIQRQAVREAAALAGLHIERILNEPTAAAVAYGYGRELDKTVLVYDLGGGTFDATVLHIKNDTFEVLATDGDPFLGGSDFDDRLTEYVLGVFERAGNPSLRADRVAVQRVRFAIELAKRQLSEATFATIDLPYIAQSAKGALHLQAKIEREIFERLCQDLVDRTMQIVQVVLDRAGVTSRDLGDVLLVGGQSRSPFVRRILIERFGKKPTAAVHPTEAVAIGAALVARALHSDIAVHLADILPATISLINSDGSLTPLVKRGTRLPVKAEFEVSAKTSGVAEIRVQLCRGESLKPEQNSLLGTIVFPPIASSAALYAKAQVTLKLSGDGLLSVTAKHPMTGEVKELDLVLTSK